MCERRVDVILNLEKNLFFTMKVISPSRDLNTGPADYKSAALPTKPLRRHILYEFTGKKDDDDHTVNGRIKINNIHFALVSNPCRKFVSRRNQRTIVHTTAESGFYRGR